MSADPERFLYTLPDGTPRWLTPAEAVDEGFCLGCGAFVAGIDAEIPSMSKFGICSECLDELIEDTEGGTDFVD